MAQRDRTGPARAAILLGLALALAPPVAVRPADAAAEATGSTSGPTVTPEQPRGASATARPRARPYEPGRPDLRCTADRQHCVSLKSYIPDVCRTIEATAEEAGLDVGFFARLLWKESLFDAAAISPVGAQGIAQFMPGTAKLRGLRDPFNPAEAMRASATYLAELRDFYGNLGLAAAAYNAGEGRVDDFVLRDRILPPETRAYVPAITGFPGVDWRDAPPEDFDLRLDKERPFREACEEMARNRSLKEFRRPSSVMPWGVIVAANPKSAIMRAKYNRLRRDSAMLRGQDVVFVRMRLPARAGRHYTAQIGAASRQQASSLCWKLRKGGVPCVVLRN